LIVRYPREIPAAAVNDRDLVLNLDFAPTFLEYAGLDAHEEMQGRSLRSLMQGRTPGDWRQSIYYHYYEYPGCHAVKRHYGVRTRRYKLIHFYHDIDAWELYDLEKDPRELKNVYDDPAYAGVKARLEAELDRLRVRYGDGPENRYMPGPEVRKAHRAVGCPVRLKHPYSPRYPGGGPGALTDGILSPEPLSLQPDYRCWQGFEEVDLEAVVDLGKEVSFRRVSAAFLQNTEAWIFLPLSVEFASSLDGGTFSAMKTIPGKTSRKRPGIFKQTFQCEGPDFKARYLRVSARNVGRCPAWHAGAGSKAWLFADEIVVE